MSDIEIATYTALRMVYMKNKTLYNVNGSSIYYSLSGNVCMSQYIVNEFNNGIIGLNTKGMLTITQNRNNIDFEIDLSKFNITNTKNNYYTIVSDTEIHKIINSGEKYRFKILRYFLYLTTTFLCSSKDKFAPPISYKPATQLARVINAKNIKTIYRYNEFLEKLELIYVYRSGDFTSFKSNSVLSGISNVYGRYKDKDIVIQEGRKYAESYGVKTKELSEIKNAKSTRSASQKYNIWCRGEKEYSYNELKTMYVTLVEYNKKYEGIDYAKHKDLTVFKDYDFYKPPENEDLKPTLPSQTETDWVEEFDGILDDMY